MGNLWRCLVRAALLGQLAAATQLRGRDSPAASFYDGQGRKAIGRRLPHPRAGVLTPEQFLIASSRSEGTLHSCELVNFQNPLPRGSELVRGLRQPAGLAFEPANNILYVADPGAASVYAYKLALDTAGHTKRLRTLGGRATIRSNVLVDWLAIDPLDKGLLFTDRNSSAIYKLDISPDTVERIILGLAPNEYMPVVQADAVPNTWTSSKAKIIELFNNESLDVKAPSAVMSDGLNLFWVNSAEGNRTSGDLVEASSKREAQVQAQTAALVASGAARPDAIAASRTHLFWTGETESGLSAIFATSKSARGGRHVYRILPDTPRPRGLAWDGDNTLYVADEDLGRVYSMPVGTIQLEPPMSFALEVPGAYGVALVFGKDL